MIRNYIKVVLRNIRRHAGYSFINIAGLAIGMACCLMITMWVLDELSYDRFHANAPDLYRVEENQFYSGRVYHVTVTPYPLAPALKEEIPEIVEASRYVYSGGLLFKHGDKAFFENQVRAVDPSFLRMFSFPLVKGDPATALTDPSSVLLSETTARKYFGDEDPLEKTITVNNDIQLRVAGVLEDFPLNSSIRADVLIPYEILEKRGRTNASFGSNSIGTYVQLRPGTDKSVVDAKIKGFIKERVPQSVTDLELFPYTRIHLHQYFGYDSSGTAVRYVYIFSVIAAFVLLIACINFMNLATARSAGRAKEVGLRKVVGALRKNLVARFYSESMTYAVIGLVVAVGLVLLFLPWFNNLAAKELSLDLGANRGLWLGFIAITLVTGFLAGSYPAIFLSSFQPVRVIKGSLAAGRGGRLFRRVLVVVQFALSVFLIIGTLVVARQTRYMRTKPLGFDKEQLLYITLRGTSGATYDALKAELANDSRILGVTGSTHLPSSIGSNSSGVSWQGKDPEQIFLVSESAVDYDYIKVMGIELLEGRNFSREFGTDETEAFLVNEEVRKAMEKDSVAGEQFSFAGRDGRIVGVMKNFHFESLNSKIEPLALFLRGPVPESGRSDWEFTYALIRVAPGNVEGAIDFIREKWAAVNPGTPFEFQFLDDQIDAMYRTEERVGRLLKTFAGLAIFIACLGLFGLASFMAEQRTREIGIRKVLGASVPQISALLCREFFFLVLLANLIAWPAAYWALGNWLESYAYRIPLGFAVFLVALGAALVITALTVSFQAVRAAVANPAHALKYE
jgi:predicted permease